MAKDVIHILVEPGLNLLESKAQAFADNLLATARKLASEPPGSVIVILDQVASAGDHSPRFLNELENDLLLDELVLRMIKMRLIFALIKASPQQWVYAARGDVLGGHCELALACSGRVFANHACRMGYPALEAGLFPWGGQIETVGARIKPLEQWKSEPVFSVASLDTLPDTFIFPLPQGEWREAIAEWAFERLPPVNTAESVSKTRLETLRKLEQVFDAGLEGHRFVKFDALRGVDDASHATSWDLCMALLKKARKDLEAEDRAVLTAYIAARHLFSPDYLNWLGSSGLKETVRAPREPVDVGTVYVDLHFEVPPAETMFRLLMNGTRIIFFTEDPVELRRGLELAYSRLERFRGPETAQKLWDQGVFWFVSHDLEFYDPIMRWSVDDKVSLEHEAGMIELVRVAGNRGRAPCGICEWVTGNPERDALEKDKLFRLLAMLSDGIIKTKPFPNPLFSSTMFCRSFAFEELLRCASWGPEDITKVISALEEAKWLVLGSQGFWNRFLTARHGIQPVDSRQLSVGRKNLWVEAFDVGMWKEARALIQETPHASPVRSLSPIILNQHFAILSGILAVILANNGIVKNLAQGDILVHHALGVPAAVGLPSHYLMRLGANRVLNYTERYWPDLIDEVRIIPGL